MSSTEAASSGAESSVPDGTSGDDWAPGLGGEITKPSKFKILASGSVETPVGTDTGDNRQKYLH